MSNLTQFLGDTVKKCVENDIELKLVPEKSVTVDTNIKCSGYFDNTSLVVATGKSDWVDVLVHETCHLDQYLEKIPVYDLGDCGITVVDNWLAGKQVSEKKLKTAFENSIMMELDCERRTVKKIEKYKLKINITKYIQQVNAYLFSYWATYKNRKWYPFPYNTPKIVNNMPKKFLSTKEYLAPHSVYLKFFNEKDS